jgi:diguanylate cyclase
LFNEIEINITVSIGVAIYPDSTTVPEELIILEDSALYEAKRTGRNKVVLFNEQIKNFPL